MSVTEDIIDKALDALARLFQPIPLAEPTPPRPSCLFPFRGDHPDEPNYDCRCHKQMGNDFWFLPSERCLWDNK